MSERDKLHSKKIEGEDDSDKTLYVITPTPMLSWMKLFKE